MERLTRKTLTAAGPALALAIAHCSPAFADPKERLAIENKLQQYEDRFNEENTVALAKLFSDEVVYYGPLGQIFKGRAAVQQRYQQSFDMGFSDMTIETIEIEVLGDTAYDIARYTVRDPQGELLKGYHLAILQKVEGEWFVQRTLVNAVMSQLPAE